MAASFAVLSSVLWESIFSTLLAPIVMLQHSWYVFNILAGISTGWGAQQRQDRALPWRFVIRSYGAHTLAGAAATAILLLYGGRSFIWFVPLLAGLLLAIPLVQFTSSLQLGERLRRARLFLIPSETHGLPILARAHALADAGGHAGQGDVRRLVLEDAAVRRLHLALLSDVTLPSPASDPAMRAGLLASARRRELDGFSAADWTALLSDAESLRALEA